MLEARSRPREVAAGRAGLAPPAVPAMSSHGMALPTPASQLRNWGAVAVPCNRCRRVVPLNLPAMVARGLGEKPLVELPLRCRTCGSRSFALICLTGHTGPAWSALRPQRQ